MKLQVTTAMATSFETTTRTIVSRIAVPRKGDKVNIKYNPADLTQVYVMS
jgi:hypothetical protein